MDQYFQTFADMNKSFNDLRKVKQYQYIAVGYAVFGVLAAVFLAATAHWYMLYCSLVSLGIAAYYLYLAKIIDRSVLDLLSCNITVDGEMISVYQAAEGKYETLNLYFSEIAEVYTDKKVPLFYVRMKPTATKSSYFIDGNNMGKFATAEIKGKDYDPEEFRQAYQTFLKNIKMYGIDSNLLHGEAFWKKKKNFCHIMLPLILLVVPLVLYITIKVFTGEFM